MDAFRGTVETDRLGQSLWVLRLIGEHDLSTVPAITESFSLIAASGTTVVADLSEASFIDSSVIGTLISHTGPGEHLLLVAPSASPARKLLNLVGVRARVPIFETHEEAMRAVPEHDLP
jgi:anti-sigma B factor antagonist